jgi:hypothetical protein
VYRIIGRLEESNANLGWRCAQSFVQTLANSTIRDRPKGKNIHLRTPCNAGLGGTRHWTFSFRPPRPEASNASTSACFLLVMMGWRPIDATSPLDLGTSENRQSAADMKRRNTLRNYAGNRRMIDTAFDIATGQPSARRRDRFSDGEPVALRIGSVHAIKRDQVALVVAHSHVYDYVELLCLCDSSGNDFICLYQS